MIKIFLETPKSNKTRTYNKYNLISIILKTEIILQHCRLQFLKTINLIKIHRYLIKKNLRLISIKYNLFTGSLLKLVLFIKPRKVSININISLIKFSNIFNKFKKVFIFLWIILEI